MSLNLEERLEDILKTEISSSLYYVYNELVVAMLGDMVDIFTYIVFIDNLYQHNNISPYHHINLFLLLDVRLLKTEASLLVESLEIDGEEQGENAEACEYYQWHGVVVGDEVGTGFLGCYNGWIVCVGRSEEVADELRYEAEADVLYPEDEAVSGTENLFVNDFRY